MVTASGSDAVRIGVNALLRLEYRGYDSAGITALADAVNLCCQEARWY